MPPKMPRLDDLLALLEVSFAPETPGETATKAELEAQARLPLLSFPPPHLLLQRPVVAVLSGFFDLPPPFCSTCGHFWPEERAVHTIRLQTTLRVPPVPVPRPVHLPTSTFSFLQRLPATPRS
ncbi:hypothetical protein FNYG_12337 [Fusarium nygamai]|uniref:Uncharacterized protein n=1 Tax=Gibberella nygamai TaxID=42673 RepID=A0A2K0VW94_GIBNY|nr:hypothetical protein FNYG_12337 [Fusarium nygamai]